jgi:1,4-dihydroxy-2-naphthoate octaprenyltransferase
MSDRAQELGKVCDRIRPTPPLGALIGASHPGPTVAVTSIAVLLGIAVGLDGAGLSLVGLTVLVGQLSIGWSNDWWDATRDAAAGRSDKPAARGDIGADLLRTAALLAVALVVPLSLVPGWAGVWHLALVASGWVYNLALKATPLSPLPYFVGFAGLPLYVIGVSGSSAPPWMAAAGGALGVAAHFANAAPDVDADRAAGVLGLPQRVGARRSVVTALTLLAGVGVLLLSQIDLSGWAQATALAVVAAPVLGGLLLVLSSRFGRPLFVLVALAAVADVALLAAAA